MIIEHIIGFSIRYRWLVLLAALGVAALGVYNFERLPIDAVPDITNVQVQINTAAYGLSAPEIERRITYPIEAAMAGIPGLESTRSLSYYGLSQVVVVFKEGTDIYLARQLTQSGCVKPATNFRIKSDPIWVRLPQVLGKSTYGRSTPAQEPKNRTARPTH